MTDTHPDLTHGTVSTAPHRRDLRWTIAKLLAASALVAVFILVLGDVRRKSVPLHQAQVFVKQLRSRQGDLTILPLNLEFTVDEEFRPGVYRFDTLTREQARALREFEGPVVLAHTRHLNRIFLGDGRVAVIFDHGTIDARWLTPSEFDEHIGQRDRRLNTKSPTNTRPTTSAP